MWNRDGRNSALDRAQALLSAKRNDANATEQVNPFERHGSDAHLYGHTGPGRGSVKKSRFPSNTHILSLDLSDISSVSSFTEHGDTTNTNGQARKVLSPQDFRASTSLGEGGGGSRFLKKALPKAMASTQSPQFRKNQTQHPPERRFVASSQQGSQSAALSRLASIEGRIRARQQSMTRGPAIEGDPHRAVPPTASHPSLPPSHGRSPPELPVERLSPALSSDDPGSPRKRFLKKTSALATANGDLGRSQGAKVGAEIPAGVDAGLSAGKHSSGSAVKLWPGAVKPEPEAAAAAVRGFSLDSDEEDMRRLLGDSLDSMEDSLLRRRLPPKVAGKASGEKPAPRPGSAPRRPSSSSAALSAAPSPSGASSPSPHSPPQRSLSSPSSWGRGEVRSLEELFPAGPRGPAEEEGGPRSGRSSSISSEDFKINVMSLDDLVPVFTLETKQKDHRPPEQKAGARTWTPQPLENEEDGPGEEEETAADYQSDFQSLSIRTEQDHSPSEISEHLGGSDEDDDDDDDDEEEKKKKTTTTTKKKMQEEDEVSEVSSHPDGSRWGGGDSGTYHSSFSQPSRSSPETRSLESRDTSGGPAPSSPGSRRSRTPRGPGREAATQTHPDPLCYAWPAGVDLLGPAVGTGHVDPTPVASHMVGAEALEALTTYSPAAFALNNMLRQQLAMTRQFVQASRQLHNSVVQGLGPADYTYTTLEDTKQFIHKHRPPKLSVEKALEEVLQEMRDYHYI